MTERYINIVSICLIAALQLTFAHASRGQDLSADLNSMYRFCSDRSSFKADVLVEVFSGKEAASRTMVKKASMRKKENSFYYKVGNTEMLLTETDLIMADNDSRQVLYRKLTKEEFRSAQKKYFSAQLDSIIQKYDSVVYHGITSGNKHYTIYTSKKLIRITELYLNASDNIISRMTYFYDPQYVQKINKVEITFENTDTSPVLQDDLFSPDNFFIRTGKVYKLAGRYSAYKLNIIDYED